ncbi:MAG: hypothetical protein K8T89_02565 [Planctomycetes bacterium]|nr:hypothetical protein [Planctomycetota bacterium]
MKITASGGTDGANIVLFWPDNLPEDADAALQNEPITLVEALRAQGKLIWFLCEGDGGYTVAIYVQRQVPENLMALCRDEEQIPNLLVRGTGYFGGMEYMFKRDSSFLTKYPQMCEQVRIPEGNYSARVYRTESRETLYNSWILTQAGAAAKRISDLHGVITACAVVGVFASVITLFVASLTIWYCITALAAIFVFVAVAMSRTESYRAVAKAKEAFEKEYPSYVVHLE